MKHFACLQNPFNKNASEYAFEMCLKWLAGWSLRIKLLWTFHVFNVTRIRCMTVEQPSLISCCVCLLPGTSSLNFEITRTKYLAKVVLISASGLKNLRCTLHELFREYFSETGQSLPPTLIIGILWRLTGLPVLFWIHCVKVLISHSFH